MSKGVHIAFEGIDGSGLTTHTKMIVERLNNIGVKAWYSKEPTSGPIGRLIRSFLSMPGEPSHEMLALLFAADRYWNYYSSPTPLKELLGKGFIVVSDRYKYSSIAYQGAFTSIDWVWNVNSRVPHSDIIVYIDVPVEIALKRILERSTNKGSQREAYEKKTFLNRIKIAYEDVLKRCENEGIIIWRIQGVLEGVERMIKNVNDEIFNKLLRYLNL